MDPASRRRAHAAILELLEQRHGIGRRGKSLPAWVEVRLDRALAALSRGSDLASAVERLQNEPARLAEVADLLRVGETRFYRDPLQWEALRSAVIPEFSRRASVRALSVGCSSGEEAWTLAMLLDAARGRKAGAGGGARFRVVGMDRSAAALAAAREGLYAEQAARQLPPELSAQYLEQLSDGARIHATLRPYVSFVCRDAMQGPPPGQYEIIVCKNLFIYFGDDALVLVVNRLVAALADRGILLVARSEVPRVRALGHRTREMTPGIVGFCA
jgi:chemotaxis protein methyltransferase CheR